MTLSAFRKLNPRDYALSTVEENVDQALGPVLAVPFLDGRLLSISLASGVPKSINHLLGRLPVGWFIIDRGASATIWRSAPFSTTTLTLTASADVAASVWVF